MYDALLDLLLGTACVACGIPGRVLCRACLARLPTNSRQVRTVRPDPCPPGLATAVAAAEYADPVRSLILRHKEESLFGLARPLGTMLAASVRTVIDAIPGDAATLLVPVPSRPAVVRARGHDPTARVVGAAVLALRREGHRVHSAPLLRLRRAVDDQSGLDALARAENLRDAMAVRAGPLRRFARRLAATGTAATAVVCDDVLTTGATAREAQRALDDVGVPVAAIAVIAATRRRAPGAG